MNLLVGDRSADVEGDAGLNTAGEIENNIVFHHVGGWVEYVLELQNTSSKKLTITGISDNNTNSYIAYSYDDHTNEEIAAGASLMLKVKATYANEVTNLNDRSQNAAMKISIDYKTEELVAGTADIEILVPDTGVNTIEKFFSNPDSIATVIMIIVAAGMAIILVIKRKKMLAVAVCVFVFAFVFSPNSTAEPAKINEVAADFAFDFSANFELDDKLAVSYTIDEVDDVQAIGWGMTVNDLQKPTREGYSFTRWYDINGRYVDGSTLITSDLNLVPDWNIKTAKFSVGCTYCGGDYSIQTGLQYSPKLYYSSVKTNTTLGNNIADVFMKSPTKPSEETITAAWNVAASDSTYPIYLWYDANDNALYWWSEAKQVKLPSSSKYAFYQFPARKFDLNGIAAVDVRNMEGMFEYSKATEIVFGEDFNTSRVYNMSSLFYGLSGLTSVDLANLDTSNVSNFNYMFNATNFTTLDLRMFDMSNMYSTKSMFSYITKLTDIKLPVINIDYDADLSELFDQDTSLVTVDISPIKLDEYACPNLEYMFRNNKNLVTIYADPSMNYYSDSDECVWIDEGYLGESEYIRDFTIFDNDTKLVGGNGSSYATHRPRGNYPYAEYDGEESSYYVPANEAPYFRIDGAGGQRGFLTAKPAA